MLNTLNLRGNAGFSPEEIVRVEQSLWEEGSAVEIQSGGNELSSGDSTSQVSQNLMLLEVVITAVVQTIIATLIFKVTATSTLSSVI